MFNQYEIIPSHLGSKIEDVFRKVDAVLNHGKKPETIWLTRGDFNKIRDAANKWHKDNRLDIPESFVCKGFPVRCQ